MGQGMDICLAVDAGSASPQEHLEARFVRCLVCQAGIVLAGRKPAAVFGFRMPPDTFGASACAFPCWDGEKGGRCC